MIKKLIFLLATVGLVANISGCTSKSAQDETEIVENADVDKIDAESSALTDESAAPTSDDASLQAALGEAPAPVVDETATAQLDAPLDGSLDLDAPATTDASTDVASTEPVTASPDIAAAPTLDESSLNDIPPPTDPSVMAMTDTPALTETPLVADAPAATETAPLIESPVVTDETPTADASSSYASETSSLIEPAPAAKPAGSQLKKVALTSPYQHGNGWVNTVYVARPGEKLKQISQTIFGSDKSKDLKGIAENSYLKSRSVKAGDKIYYVSPNRPDDSTKTILYYEDMGMVPETYVAKAGDRLKKVSKKLLGYDKAWVEMWTSNPVESKDKLAEGDVLKYWKSASSIAPTTLAQNTSPDAGSANLVDSTQMPTAPPADPMAGQQMAQNTPPPDMNSLPPPPPPDAPMPPPPDMNSAGAVGEAPPPPPDMNAAPPPPPDMAPPPPADVVAGAEGGKKFNPNAGEEEASAIGGLDQDTMMSMGALAVLVIALAFVMISRSKKKRAAEQAMTENNFGT